LFVIATPQGLWFAGIQAVGAKGAFASGKIDGRKTTVAGNNNLFRAGAQTIITAGTGVDEFSFSKRPGRANLRLNTRSTAKEAAPTRVYHALFT